MCKTRSSAPAEYVISFSLTCVWKLVCVLLVKQLCEGGEVCVCLQRGFTWSDLVYQVFLWDPCQWVVCEACYGEFKGGPSCFVTRTHNTEQHCTQHSQTFTMTAASTTPPTTPCGLLLCPVTYKLCTYVTSQVSLFPQKRAWELRPPWRPHNPC